ncbi:MAG: hypothetical protein CMQ20_01980 [Gammaproteobacteria bacterium]|jgi:cytoskeleton protein RodZ|nr:hypothetical protein [Gammaproteobacteria bacterium]|tara:strand:- start:695 stop:1717 length:1023 start_codon:yes stop_codon:yes gene_type:complete
MAELEPNSEVAGQPALTASELLVAAREKAGLTQKEVADELYLTTAFIRYLDEGNFDKIPRPAFIKGYLRSYARVVGASGDDVVSRYGGVLQDVVENVRLRDVTEETVGSVKFTGPILQTGLIGLLGVIGVVAIVWWVASSDEDNQRNRPRVVVSQPESEPATGDDASSSDNADFEFVVQEQELADSVVDEEIANEPLATDEKVNEPETEEEPGGASLTDEQRGETDQDGAESDAEPPADSVKVERNNEGGVNHITVDAGGVDEIEIRFSDECWLEIEDANVESVYSDLNRSGDILRVFGTAPFTLLLGRAPAVTVLFNGEETDISKYISSDDTAKVVLGR